MSVRPLVKLAILWVAKHTGLFHLSRRLTRSGARILCYHGIWLGPGHFADYLFMSPGKFRRRMAWLARSGYPVLSLEAVTQGLAAGTLPPYATAITIDDGWYGSFRHMAPVLTELKLPATVYISTYYVQKQLPVFDVALQYLFARAPQRIIDFKALAHPAFAIGDSGPLNLDRPVEKERAMEIVLRHAFDLNGAQCFDLLKILAQHLQFDFEPLLQERVFHLMTEKEVQTIAEQGMDVQLHTHRHRLTLENVQNLTKELTDNRSALAAVSNVPLEHFCYPSGVWSEQCWPILQAAGVKSATTTIQGLNYAGANPMKLKRLLDGESVHDLEFEAELSGLFDLKRMALASMRHWIRRSHPIP